MRMFFIAFLKWRYHLFTLLLASMWYQTANTSSHQDFLTGPVSFETNKKVAAGEANLKVLTWNVYMLPYLQLIHHSDSRAAAIGDRLKNSDYDIIFFQETFHTASREILKKKLSEGYQYFYGPFNDPGVSFLTSSGLFVASRIPLYLAGTMEFNRSASFDAMACKGAVLLEGIKDGYRFQVITTHMQADQSDFYREIRKKQMQQIFLELLVPFAKRGVPQIICGDLNINSDDTMARRDIQRELFVGSPTFANCIPSYDEVNNTLANDSDPYARTLDYIVVSNTGNHGVRQKTVIIKGYDGSKPRFLSDHHAVEAVIPLNLLADDSYRQVDSGSNEDHSGKLADQVDSRRF